MDATGFSTGPAIGLVLQPPGESDVEKIFQHFFSQRNLFSTIPHNLWSPPTDVYETHDRYVIRIEIPGVGEGDVDIELNHNVLTVRGCRRDTSCDVKISFHQMEIHYGYFEKVVTLPHGIDPDVKPATYCDGFLCVTVDKAAPQRAARRRIEIET